MYPILLTYQYYPKPALKPMPQRKNNKVLFTVSPQALLINLVKIKYRHIFRYTETTISHLSGLLHSYLYRISRSV